MFINRYRRQGGVAAVELALILPLLALLLALCLSLGRVFWHYTAAQKAAQDGARYLSTIPLADMQSAARIGYSLAVAQWIVDSELADLRPGSAPTPTPTPAAAPFVLEIRCDGKPCAGLAAPARVSVSISMRVFELALGPFMSTLAGADGVPLAATSTMRYVPH